MDWLRRHGARLSLDAGLAAVVIWFAFVPPSGIGEILLHAAAVSGVLMRVHAAWRDWRLAPWRLNRAWHRHGRDAGTAVIDKIARVYRLERKESVVPFDGELGTALLHARQDFPVRCGLSVPATGIDAVSDAVHGFWLPVDRSGALPSPGLRMQVLDPIPDASGFTTGFADVCHRRARQLLDEDREIALFWSGGIDSTGALAALLMQAGPADRDRLHIFLRPRSIGEYPAFFDSHVRQLNHTVMEGPGADGYRNGPGRTFSSDVGAVLSQQARRRLVVTGEHGDQLFGSMALAENPDWIGQPPDRFLERPEFTAHREEIEQLNSACPVPVDTIDAMLWWWNFAVKWQEITFRSLSDLDEPSSFANIRHFYQTDDFQRWSIANPDLKIRDSLESYKWPAKDFIYDFTGDADYRDHKIKVGSLRVRIGAILGIDNRHNIIKAGQTSTDPAKLRVRYGDRLQRFLAQTANPAADLAKSA